MASRSATDGRKWSAPARNIRRRVKPRRFNLKERFLFAGEIMGMLTTLLNASNALQVYDKEFSAIQNNIANQNTPGYVEQNLATVADSYNPSEALYGGISAGP